MSTSGGRAPDPRPARTKAALFAAARNLCAAGDKVTVNDLVRLARVSRSAFYTHYEDIEDLLGEMLDEMFEGQEARVAALAAAGRSAQEIVHATAASMAAYACVHQAFLRGSLNWKVRHRAYVGVVQTCARLHEEALRQMGKDLPADVDIARTAQFFAGGTMQVIVDWFVLAGQDVHGGAEADENALVTSLLRVLPSWYTGLAPSDPIPATLRTVGMPSPAADGTSRPVALGV
ncbi:TetR/AcrR family transcriptional regulator [Brachybacterium sp. UNK5269]|uniref:TetR/AcrR family transcriptional regulator n=1 Tax=Brachybacterium sp. UNK5269 TaxID=3408576 RepID=UPI003BAFE013